MRTKLSLDVVPLCSIPDPDAATICLRRDSQVTGLRPGCECADSLHLHIDQISVLCSIQILES